MRLLLLLALAAGCSHRPLPLPDPAGDLAVRDPATPDLSTPPDLSTAKDLSAPPDLSTPPDLGEPDLARAGFVALPTESRPFSQARMAAGDVDGDGRADVVTLDLVGPRISFYRGRGDGTLEPGRSQPLAPSSIYETLRELAAGDLDGDGDLDAVAATPRGIFVYYGNSSGLVAGETLELPSGVYAIALAHLDGDGRLDLVAKGYRRAVWMSRASGGFAPPILVDANEGGALAAGDLDGDGRADLVTGRQAQVRIGLGDGRFVDGARIPEADAPLYSSGYGFTLADLDGDGVLDLLYPAGVLHGNGDGTFRATAIPAVAGQTVAVGDFDFDGKRDFAAVGGWQSEAVTLPIRFAADAFATVTAAKMGCRFASGVASADFDRDGAADLVVSCSGTSTVSVLLNTRSRTLAPPRPEGISRPVDVVAADFDGDGRADLAMAQLSGAVTLRRGLGDGRFDEYRDLWLDRLPNPQSLAAADLDEDGDLDLVIFTSTGGGPMILLRNHGDGTFAVETQKGIGWYPIAIADVDGDRHLDLIAADTTLYFAKGRGDGSFAPRVELATGGPMAGASGDFDGDGRLDLAHTLYQRDIVVVRRGRGDGSFDAPLELPAGSAPLALTAVDLDRDGALDLVAAKLDGSIANFRGRGDGSFHPRADTAVSPNKLSTLRTADFDGDGAIDLVLGSYDPVGIFFVRGRGDGGFAPVVPYSAGDGSIVDRFAVADLDGDGRLDLAGISGANNSSTVLLNRF